MTNLYTGFEFFRHVLLVQQTIRHESRGNVSNQPTRNANISANSLLQTFYYTKLAVREDKIRSIIHILLHSNVLFCFSNNKKMSMQQEKPQFLTQYPSSTASAPWRCVLNQMTQSDPWKFSPPCPLSSVKRGFTSVHDHACATELQRHRFETFLKQELCIFHEG